MNSPVQYINGNHTVSIYPDGTKIKETISPNSKKFTYDFPESFDFKINDRCSAGCPYCHESSSPEGKSPSIIPFLFSKFFLSLHPHTEIAVGGGNLFETKLMYVFLEESKKKELIVNLTVSQRHLKENFKILQDWKNKNLFSGLGISLVDSSSRNDLDLISELGEDVVIHVINGIVSEKDLPFLENKKVLVLGFKNMGKGGQYLLDKGNSFSENTNWLEKNLRAFSENCRVLAFDNLAIDQLSPKEKLEIPDEDWEEFYDGRDDAPLDPLGNICSGTMFVDYPKMEIARSSTSVKRFTLELDETVEENFRRTFCENQI